MPRESSLTFQCLTLLLVVCELPLVQSSSPTQRHYNVTIDHNITSFIGGNYDSLNSLSLEDDEVFHMSLPFEFQFFQRRFKDAYLSSNGLLSFEVEPSSIDAAAVFSSAFPVLPLKPSSTSGEENAQVSGESRNNKNRNMNEGEKGSKIVILHRHLRNKHMSLLLQDIYDRHHSQDSVHVNFTAHVSQTVFNLRMFSTSHLSPAALEYLTSHEHVLHIQANTRLSLDTTTAFGVNSHSLRTTSPLPPSHTNVGAATTQYAWGLDRLDQATLPLDQAAYVPPADTRSGRGSSVYIVDTGIDTTHVEFQSGTDVREVKNIFNYFGDIEENQDKNGHGTHCAGSVGGLRIGVAPGANVYGVQVLDNAGSGNYDSVLAGLDYVLGIRILDTNKPMVVSMSLAGLCGDDDCSKDALVLAVEELKQHRVPSVVAAGNAFQNACAFTPGGSPSAITVGATGTYDHSSSFSNWGTCVDMFAPGEDIISACSSATAECLGADNLYSYKSGTSMSTPYVAGVVALWLSQTEAEAEVHAETPSTELIKNALQCTSAQDVLHLHSGPNLLLQVPPPGYAGLHDITCNLDFGCKHSQIAGGVNSSCSGNGQCVAGICECAAGAFGDTCEVVLPWWEYESFCCHGRLLSSHDEESLGPYNTIAFLWTDLDPSLASVYYGSVRTGTAFMVVFDRVPFFRGSLCSATVEVVIHASSRIEIILINNELGYLCRSANISIGVKGSYFASAAPEYEQFSGPSLWAPEHLHAVLEPLFVPPFDLTSSPTIAPSAANTLAATSGPTVDVLLSYSVSKVGSGKSFVHNDYVSLTPLNISQDSYVSVALPFSFNFFRRLYDTLYIREDGRLSFSMPFQYSDCCRADFVQYVDTEIVFLWTDLWFESGGIAYYGATSNDTVVVVFDQVSPDGYFCSSTVEIQLHSSGVIEIAYLKNSIGFSCGAQTVSAGIVGSASDMKEYHQLFGPSPRGFPFSETVVYAPLFNATDVYSDTHSGGSDGLGSAAISVIVVVAVLCVCGGAGLLAYYLMRRTKGWRHDLINDADDEEVVFTLGMESTVPLSVKTVLVRSQEQEENQSLSQ